jgi:hypothetical protein
VSVRPGRRRQAVYAFSYGYVLSINKTISQRKNINEWNNLLFLFLPFFSYIL